MRDLGVVAIALEKVAPENEHGEEFSKKIQTLLQSLPYTAPERFPLKWGELANAVNAMPESAEKTRMGAILEDRESADQVLLKLAQAAK